MSLSAQRLKHLYIQHHQSRSIDTIKFVWLIAKAFTDEFKSLLTHACTNGLLNFYVIISAKIRIFIHSASPNKVHRYNQV